MNLKKQFVFLLILALLLPISAVSVSASETPEFRYELTVDGKDIIEAQTGDLITVTLHLYRTDEDSSYNMYAMQDEIRYDSTFFELVTDSPQLYRGVQCKDIGVTEDFREFYMSYLSFGGGEKWQQKTRVGTFQLRVIGTAGTSTVTNEDYRVSQPDGSESYVCDANTLTVILSTECTVKFATNGGTPIDPITVFYGEKIPRPEDPSREGKVFAGWFKDIHLTDEWDFDTDTVVGNMTLYAKWADPDSVTPDTDTGKMHCMICGRECEGIFGIAICRLCLLIIILILLILVLIIRRICDKDRKHKKKGKYSG